MKSRLEEGFTLWEMLVVLAVLALATALSLPLVRTPGGGSLDAVARIIAARLSETRSLAISENTRNELAFDIKTRTVSRSGHGELYRIPESMGFTLTTADNLAMDEQANFAFFADGGSTGGSITLSDRGLTRRIAINWLTGAIVIEDGAKP